MKIKVLDSVVESKAKYKQISLKYFNIDKDAEGSTKVVSFGDSKDAFLSLVEARPGDVYEVELKKNGEYWNFVKATKLESGTGGNVGGTSKTSSSPRSTYETPEERALRQIYIVRQSSLERAITYFGLIGEKKATVDDVLSLATTFSDFVFKGLNKPITVETMDDDIPL